MVKELSKWKNTTGLRCPKCKSTQLYKDGFVHHAQRYCCKKCEAVTIKPKGGTRRSQGG